MYNTSQNVTSKKAFSTLFLSKKKKKKNREWSPKAYENLSKIFSLSIKICEYTYIDVSFRHHLKIMTLIEAIKNGR